MAGSAEATRATLVRRNCDRRHATVSALDLTCSHRAGTGTSLLLLHGIGAIWRAWSPVLPYLEPHHEVIAPTLHGHAGGPPLGTRVAPSVQALVDGIAEELDRLGLPKCISPEIPLGVGSASNSRVADARNHSFCSAPPGPGGRPIASS